MDHYCTNPDCDFWDCNNKVYMTCPECGSECVGWWDEEYSDREDDSGEVEEMDYD
jgi:predicted  nucleic acid-binding Zn-ribbon protein